MVIINGFILMVLMGAWKWIVKKFGVEMGRFIVHGFLFVISLIYAVSQYWGNWGLLVDEGLVMWTTASGSYEVLVKTIIPLLKGKTNG